MDDEEKMSDYLLFEDRSGMAEVVPCELLKKHIEDSYGSTNTLEFVFVASCHSEIVGDVFLQAGASHVLCVRREEKISDKICNAFTELFYRALFGDNLSFCGAYKKALMQIQAKEEFMGEERKFVMLKKVPGALHQCTRLIVKPTKSPKFVNLTKEPKFNRLPSKVDLFRGRKRELYEISSILDSYRFVLVKGMLGAGKSSLVREFGFRALNRRLYQDGVIYVNMRGKEMTEFFLDILLLEISSGRAQSAQNGPKTGFRKDRNKRKIEAISELLKTNELLLIIDNIDGILFKQKKEFYVVVNTLLAEINNLKILATSFSKYEDIHFDFTLKVYEIGPLTPYHTAKLLIERAKAHRKIEQDEVTELFKRYPLTNKTQNEARNLASHPLIQLFDGHPQTVMLGASLLSKMNLCELYELYNGTENHFQPGGCLAIDRLPSTIKASLDYAVRILEAKGSEYLKVFGLLSLFPGGATSEELGSIFGLPRAKEILGFLKEYSIAKLSSVSKKEAKVGTGGGGNRAKNGNLAKPKFYINKMIQERAKRTLGDEVAKYLNVLSGHYLKKLEKLFSFIGTDAEKMPSEVETGAGGGGGAAGGKLSPFEKARLKKFEEEDDFSKKAKNRRKASGGRGGGEQRRRRNHRRQFLLIERNVKYILMSFLEIEKKKSEAVKNIEKTKKEYMAKNSALSQTSKKAVKLSGGFVTNSHQNHHLGSLSNIREEKRPEMAFAGANWGRSNSLAQSPHVVKLDRVMTPLPNMGKIGKFSAVSKEAVGTLDSIQVKECAVDEEDAQDSPNSNLGGSGKKGSGGRFPLHVVPEMIADAASKPFVSSKEGGDLWNEAERGKNRLKKFGKNSKFMSVNGAQENRFVALSGAGASGKRDRKSAVFEMCSKLFDGSDSEGLSQTSIREELALGESS